MYIKVIKEGEETFFKEVTPSGELITTDDREKAYYSGSDYYVNAQCDFLKFHFNVDAYVC